MKILMVLKREWGALDASKTENGHPTRTSIPAGEHEMERIPNPFGYENAPWLVLKGTQIGAAEGSWRQWENGVLADRPGHPNFGKPIDWGNWEVIIRES